ncbi:GNAT family N-acetyltransferase [Mycobacterium sp. 852002-51057_SCH5723018]|uniref:GNAT family N-acetyltransferase n=1 Tax=Mycobacterium sp. 852002-51057_SCH5723018 TaxID=1834094 RepID=UPI0007FBDC9D|nr:GNAT family N-acetyltransferase [Mycobacterium sp. 852002-51057_SCH5723018]OBG24618.1 GNAT family acetyltransferase [Mycobacterium sp. 852002-51057_SCH5723018]
MKIAVRPGRRRDVRQLSRVLGRAFYNDPLMRWMLPGNGGRTRGLPALFATLARHHYLPRGGVQVAVAGNAIAGATMWSPPGRWRESRPGELRMLPGMLSAFGCRTPLIKKTLELIANHHPEEPHWYLGVIGSDPTVRGAGFGRVLMDSGLERCDAEHAPAYLESTNPANVPYYQRFGFEATGELALPGGGPVITTMWRHVRS